MFDPVTRAPLSLVVSQHLRDAIIAGDLAVGAPLPTEKELTEQFQVSRSTIREALRILQAQGLLTGGDTVTTARPKVSDTRTVGSAAQALENVLRLGQVPLPDLLDLRLLLEGAALREAAADPDPAALAAAREALAVMDDPNVDVATYHEADVAFHGALVGASDNLAYHLVFGVLRQAIGDHLLGALAALHRPVDVLARLTGEHRGILAAVEDGDGDDAAALVDRHVRGFYAAHAPDALDAAALGVGSAAVSVRAGTAR
ncbi:FadR family transcriptional regulator [Nitriliruptoraceae bacterium ZYF776]|nr:FadR family transcriptional regulator [Profundirhabdus halotolerans]